MYGDTRVDSLSLETAAAHPTRACAVPSRHGLAFILLSASLVMPAWGADDALEEIVVTSQKRTERLQDVPEAITALSGDSLNQLHMVGNGDLAKQVPSLSLNVLGPGESTLAIRGLGTSYGLAPAVSYYLNETPLDIRTDGYAGAPDIDFFDVDRIEVLRGPQGTLYGSSSLGGALRVLTAQPDPTAFAVKAEVGGSSMDGGGVGYLAKSAVNLPIGSDAAVRIVGTYEHVPGYISRATPGDYSDPAPQDPVTARRINDADLKGARVLGLWKPIEGLSIAPSLLYSEVGAASNSDFYSNLPQFTVAAYGASPQVSRLIVGNLAVSYDAGFANILSSTSVLSRYVSTLNDFTLFLANTAPAFGLAYPPNTPATIYDASHNVGFTQEVRFTSPTEQTLRWVAGAYFSHFRQHSTEYLNSADFAAAIGQTDSASLYAFDQSVIDQQTALFADLTWRIIPGLEVTAGERYYRLRDSLENDQLGPFAGANQPLVHAKASGNSPRAVVTYRPVTDATFYVSASRGYRPGGPNVGLPEGIGCSLTDAYSPLYQPDSVWDYEIGAKTELFSRRLSVNVAAYRINWKNVQQAITDPGCGSLFVANAGSARSKGVEVEVQYMPVHELLLYFSGSYNDAAYTSIAAPFVDASAVQAGDAVPDVPKQKYNLGGELTQPLGEYTGYLNVNVSHQGAVPTGFTTSSTRPAYNALEASLGLRLSHYDVSLYGHNLTNSRGIVSIQTGGGSGYGDTFDTRIVTPPRTIGVDLKMHF